jgi:hypothetical protein
VWDPSAPETGARLMGSFCQNSMNLSLFQSSGTLFNADTKPSGTSFVNRLN